MPFRTAHAGMLAALTIAACGTATQQPETEPTPAVPDEVDLIEGEESAEYERVAQISLLVFGAKARERVVDRARTRAAELGADALSFKLYPVTRPSAPATTARERRSYAAYSLMPLLRARVSCSVIERTGNEESAEGREGSRAIPDCSELDSSLRVYSSGELGWRPAVPLQDRGYILVGWVLQHRPARSRSEV